MADGTLFEGYSIGAEGLVSGEVVFNTSMTGYQEILTDPSYCRQIVTLTYPHIGNTGCTAEDEESGKVFASGLVIRELPVLASNWRMQSTLTDYLALHDTVAIAGIDTRKLTRVLREKGVQNGALMAGSVNAEKAIAEARKFPGLSGMDLAKVVSTGASYPWDEGTWKLGKGHETRTALPRHVVAFDYGVKRNILRMLVDRGCRVTVIPAQATAADALAHAPDGVFL